MSVTTSKAVTIGGALSLAIAGAIAVALTPTVVTWAAVFVGIGVMALLLSWGLTQAYKQLALPMKPWFTEPMAGARESEEVRCKRRIYVAAMSTAGFFNGLGGVVLVLFQDGSSKVALVAGVFWFMYSLLIAVSSPHLWRYTFEHLLPMLTGRISRHGVIIKRDAAGKVIGVKDGPLDDTRVVRGRGESGHGDTGVMLALGILGTVALFAIAAALKWPWAWLLVAALAVVFVLVMRRLR